MTEYTFVSLDKANDNKHKYIATFINNTTGKQKVVKFGADKYKDFTIYNAENGLEYAKEKKAAYIARHFRLNEDYENPLTRGFWALHLLWNKPTIEQSFKFVKRKLKKLGYL